MGHSNVVIDLRVIKPFKKRAGIKRCFVLGENFYYSAVSRPSNLPRSDSMEYYRCLEPIAGFDAARIYARRHGLRYVPKPLKLKRHRPAALSRRIQARMAWLARHKNSYAAFMAAALEEFRIRNTYNSTCMGSCGYTHNEVRAALQLGLPVHGKTKDYYRMVADHSEAISRLYQLAKKKRLSEMDIRGLQSLLTKGILKAGFRGRCRPKAAFLRKNKAVFPPASELPRLMKRFVRFVNSNPLGMDPVELSAMAHAELVNIHPFCDANGRTARLVGIWVLLRNGYPPITMPRSRLPEYRVAMNRLRQQGDSTALIRLWKSIMLGELDWIIAGVRHSDAQILRLCTVVPGVGRYHLSRVGADGRAIFYSSKERTAASQGYKLHIAAGGRSLERTLEVALPVLQKYGVPHKFVSPAYFLSRGRRSNLYGKLITAYVSSPRQAAKLAVSLDAALYHRGLRRGRRISGDNPLQRSKSKLVYYRYGSFVRSNHVINTKTGKKFFDNRKIPHPKFMRGDKLARHLSSMR